MAALDRLVQRKDARTMPRLPQIARPISLMAFVLLGFATARAGATSERWIVVSDIDDTIRQTGVVKDIPPANPSGAHPKNLAHLLGDPFRKWTVVPGMADKYGQWRAHDRAEFVYLSRGPWCYRARLTDFFWAGGFPHGCICLNPIFPFAPPNFKDAAIRKILRAHPGCAFVFLGDSGEADPEIYGRLARDFPAEVRRIFIRNVTPHDPPLRYRRAFAGTPGSLFTQASQLPSALDRPAKLPARHDQTSPAHRR